jgi:hypothetical protein
MTDDQRCIGVDLSWMSETEHPGAREAIASELIRAGWKYAHGESDRATFCRPDSPDFDRELATAQHIVGKWLVVET